MRLLIWTVLLMPLACAQPNPEPGPGFVGKSRADCLVMYGSPEAESRVDLDAPFEIQGPAVSALRRLLGTDAVMDQLLWRDGGFFVVAFVGSVPGGDSVVVDSLRWHRGTIIG